MVKRQTNHAAQAQGMKLVSLPSNGRPERLLAPVRQWRNGSIPDRAGPTSLNLRFHHYKGVDWVLSGGLMAPAYVAVVVHDDCQGCLVCGRTTEWFMEFARLAYGLTGINLRDCLHWGHLFDNPKPLIVPTSNLFCCNLETLAKFRESYFSLSEVSRPFLEQVWPWDRFLSQSERFQDRLTIVTRMVQLWEDGQYIGWPS